MSVQDVCAWLEKTPVALLVRESTWGFVIVVAIHILGLTVSVGTLVWFDLRLLGVSMRGYPVSSFYRPLMPWTLAGFVIMFGSGAVLFAAFATAAYGSLYFRIKAGRHRSRRPQRAVLSPRDGTPHRGLERRRPTAAAGAARGPGVDRGLGRRHPGRADDVVHHFLNAIVIRT